MSDSFKCSRCGKETVSTHGLGHCPACLLELAMTSGQEGVPETNPGVLRIFGDYELIKQIGRGGMGVVYKARRRGSTEFVALKMLRDEIVSQVAVRRFMHEADAVASLDHPNIVATHEVGELDGQCFFSMEYIEAISLEKLIKRGAFKQKNGVNDHSERAMHEKIARLMVVLARTVDYAHEQKIIHRDIKPSNILIDPEGKPYLTDFGVAKLAGNGTTLTMTGEIIGTPRYMSPEQASPEKRTITHATDIYSLGVVMYELLTGRTPFNGESAMELITKVTTQTPVDPRRRNRRVDRRLACICLKCLEKQPGHRYATAGAFADDLERWLEGKPIRARMPGLLRRTRRFMGSYPIVAVVLVFLICLLSVTMVLLKRQNQIFMNLKSSSLERMDSFWEASNRPFIDITQKEIQNFNGRLVDSAKTTTAQSNLIFAVYPWKQPTKMLEIMAPILESINESMRRNFSDPQPIVFRAYKMYGAAQDALVNGDEVDFMRVGPVSYVRAFERNPSLQLILKQDGRIRGYIFTIADSSTMNLEDLKGMRMAFVDENSTMGNVLAKYHLYRAGLTSSDFVGKGTNYLRSHDSVVEAVAKGDFEVGAANASIVDEYAADHNVQFRILKEFKMQIGFPWVARKDLDPAIIRSIREGLLSIKDMDVLRALGNSTEGFLNATNADFDSLRRFMRDSDKFDAD